MLIESLRALRVKLLDDCSINLKPGVPVELNDQDAAKLIEMRPDAVRALDDKLASETGMCVKWRSPVFPGELTGRVLTSTAEGKVWVQHPLTARVVDIPVEWLITDGKVG